MECIEHANRFQFRRKIEISWPSWSSIIINIHDDSKMEKSEAISAKKESLSTEKPKSIVEIVMWLMESIELNWFAVPYIMSRYTDHQQWLH